MYHGVLKGISQVVENVFHYLLVIGCFVSRIDNVMFDLFPVAK